MEKNPQIFIAKLDSRVTVKDLEYKFGKVGDIKNIRMRKGYAFLVKIIKLKFFRIMKITETQKEQSKS
jgi:hypothetical protein